MCFKHTVDNYIIFQDLFLQNYPTNQKHFVTIDGKISKYKITKYGVTQETVLGPALFLLYIKMNSTIISFVDDTTIVVDGNTWQKLKHNISKNLKTVNDWLKKYILTLKLRKAKY